MNKHYFSLTFFFLLAILCCGNRSFAYNLTVAKDGSGDYTTLQAAINAAPTGQTAQYTIYIKAGRYKEKVSIPSNKPFIKLIGEDVARVIITFDDYNGKFNPVAGGTWGTSNSATFTVNATDFAAENITFENTTGDSPQALAINVNGTRAAFLNCRFLGGQDTLLTNADNSSQYYRNCYIDGVVDFIFGSARAVFDSCTIHPKTRLDNGAGGYITAANTPPNQAYGYVFRNCKILSNFGTTTYFLGRPWNNGTGNNPLAQNKVVWLNATMNSLVKPAGWTIWDAGTNTAIIYYAEYRSRNFSGALVDTTQRVPWSFQIPTDSLVKYTNANIFGTWDPCTAINCNPGAPGIAIANLRGTAGATQSSIKWNICWPINNVKYELYRSKDSIVYNKIYETTALTDTLINFQTTDTLPPAGGTYFYYIKASKTGITTLFTDTVKIRIPSNISISNLLGGFLQGFGTPSPSQQYTLSGVSITGGITIAPPANFEISTDNGNTWSGSASPVTLPATSSIVAATNVLVRLNATAAGTYDGNIAHTTANHAIINLAVHGTTLPNALVADSTLIYWPFTTNNSDSATLRAAYVKAAKDTLVRLSSANGTTVAAVPAYSPVFGKAISGNNSGDGSWPAALINLNRSVYEQFTVASNSTLYGLNITSLQLSTSIFRSATGKVALSYSIDNFTLDSNNFSSATTAGTLIAPAANGAFSAPILLNTDTTGTSNNYLFQFNGNAGVKILPTQTMTVRIYYTSTSGQGYYAKIKDVYVRGNAVPVAPSNVGVPAINNKSNVTLYPNPVIGIFTLAHDPAGKNAMIRIYQADGKLVAEQPVTEHSLQSPVNVARLAPGNYIAVFTSNNETKNVKFTKQ